MGISRLSLAALALIAIALGACSSAPRKAAPAGDAGPARQARGDARSDTDIGATAARNALAMRGKPYRYGGYTPQGFDCSGLVHYSYAQAGGSLPRNTNGLWSRSRAVSRSDIRQGDLLFFHQDGKSNSHVAIYVGNNRFVHAPSSGKQVSTASLSDPYWRQHFSAARRPIL
jgi:cell wall-associated NlpC family hydrolase